MLSYIPFHVRVGNRQWTSLSQLLRLRQTRSGAARPLRHALEMMEPRVLLATAVQGVKWSDVDSDGVRDPGEPGLAGWVVYDDVDKDGVRDGGEPFATTDANGNYNLDLAPGTHTIREEPKAGWMQTFPGGGDLSQLLANLNANNAAISAQVPTRFNFSEGAAGSFIGDGGNDMYDVGNILNTNRETFIPYTNGTVRLSDRSFGPLSEYFTAKYSGLFVMAATGIFINTFTISGNNGADGGGNVNGSQLTTTVNGRQYAMFVKRVFGAGDPSINHIVLVPGNGAGITHTFPVNTDNDLHTLDSLASVDELYYLLVAREFGGFLSDDDVLNVANAFLANVPLNGAHSVTLSAGQVVTGRNFGNHASLSTVRGVKWSDFDKDGARDREDTAVDGWVIYADLDNDGVRDADEPSATTDANGEYSLIVSPGTLRIREESRAGWTRTFPAGTGEHTVTVAPGESVSGIDFGNHPGPRSIQGVKWNDLNNNSVRDPGELGLSGWTIYADLDRDGVRDTNEPSATTDSNGNYLLNVLPGSYPIREVLQAGWTQTFPGSLAVANSLANFNANHASITAQVPGVFDFSEGAVGTFIGDGGSDMYDNGNVLNTNRASAIPYTNGILAASDAQFGPGSRYFTAKYPGLFVLGAGNIAIDTFRITGNTGADGSGNVNGAKLATTVNGRAFTIFAKRIFNAGDPSINHIIMVPGSGTGISHTFSSNTDDDLDTLSGLSSTGELYYALVARQQGGFLSDTEILSVANAVLANVTVDAYQVTLVGGQNATGIDFGNGTGAPPPVTQGIRGTKWNDQDNDGVRDTGEPGLSGWIIYVDVDQDGVRDTGEPFATTDGSGNYSLQVAAGTYRVREQQQAGWAQTFPAAAGGGFHTVTVAAGQIVNGINFGNHTTVETISGVKWRDADADGVRDAGEPGVSGWIIYADLNQNGTRNSGEPFATTDANGNYTLTLAPGSYAIREELQAGWMQTFPGRGGIDNLLANLNANHAAVTAQVPDVFNFSEGTVGSFIGDGGGDMYDTGNILNTNLAAFIPYTNGAVTNSPAQFGASSQYFTAKFSGLFVLAAADAAITTFQTTGGLGADGGGTVDGVQLPVTVNGVPYTVFAKRVYGAGDPSVNHIIMIPGTGAGVTHTFPNNTDSDLHTVTGLATTKELYFLLVSRQGGGFLTDDNIRNIATAFLANVAPNGAHGVTVNQGQNVTGINFGNHPFAQPATAMAAGDNTADQVRSVAPVAARELRRATVGVSSEDPAAAPLARQLRFDPDVGGVQRILRSGRDQVGDKWFRATTADRDARTLVGSRDTRLVDRTLRDWQPNNLPDDAVSSELASAISRGWRIVGHDQLGTDSDRPNSEGTAQAYAGG